MFVDLSGDESLPSGPILPGPSVQQVATVEPREGSGVKLL